MEKKQTAEARCSRFQSRHQCLLKSCEVAGFWSCSASAAENLQCHPAFRVMLLDTVLELGICEVGAGTQGFMSELEQALD